MPQTSQASGPSGSTGGLPERAQPVPVPPVGGEGLEFTRLFQGFRMALNPAKMVIALAAIVLVCASGWLFDLVWGPQVFKQEIERYQNERPEVFRMGARPRKRNAWRRCGWPCVWRSRVRKP